MGLSRDPAVAHKVDTVIVSVHAAIEDSPWPSPIFENCITPLLMLVPPLCMAIIRMFPRVINL